MKDILKGERVKEMRRKIIFVDIDNTLANTNAQLERLGIDISAYPANVPSELWSKDIFKSAEPIEPVINFVNAIHPHYKIVYLTAREGIYHELTLHWLEKNNLPIAPIVHTNGRDKGQFIQIFSSTEKVVGAIEDSPHEINSMIDAKEDLLLFVPDWEYNRHLEKGIRILLNNRKGI